ADGDRSGRAVSPAEPGLPAAGGGGGRAQGESIGCGRRVRAAVPPRAGVGAMKLLLVLLAAGLACAAGPDDLRIGIEPWRELPVSHLFLHGTLKGGTGFHVLLPETGAWQGRLLHFLGGGMGGSDSSGGVRAR